jgi:hypothetical protein
MVDGIREVQVLLQNERFYLLKKLPVLSVQAIVDFSHFVCRRGSPDTLAKRRVLDGGGWPLAAAFLVTLPGSCARRSLRPKNWLVPGSDSNWTSDVSSRSFIHSFRRFCLMIAYTTARPR